MTASSLLLGGLVGLMLLGGGVSIALLVAVFLSNVPEAIASTSGLAASGVRSGRIMATWALVTAVSGIAAVVGYGLLGGAPQWAVAFVLAFAAGAVLTMLADTMMPEAFEHGRAGSPGWPPRSASWSPSPSPTSNRGAERTRPPGAPPDADMVWVPGGQFLMGSDRHYPEEAPAHLVAVGGFWMDRFQVTNERFRRFVKETGHLTLAQRPPDPAHYPGAKSMDRVRLPLRLRRVLGHVDPTGRIPGIPDARAASGTR